MQVNSVFHPSGVSKPITGLPAWLGLRWDPFACVRWQITRCDPGPNSSRTHTMFAINCVDVRRDYVRRASCSGVFDVRWPWFDLKVKIGTPITPAGGNVHTNFGFSSRFCFRVRSRYGRDRQTDGRTGKTRNAAYQDGRINCQRKRRRRETLTYFWFACSIWRHAALTSQPRPARLRPRQPSWGRPVTGWSVGTVLPYILHSYSRRYVFIERQINWWNYSRQAIGM